MASIPLFWTESAVWDLSSETDVIVTDIIRTNEDWTIPGNIGLAPNAEVVGYNPYLPFNNKKSIMDISLKIGSIWARRYFITSSTPSS